MYIRIIFLLCCLLVVAAGVRAEEFGYAGDASGIVSALTAKSPLTRGFAPTRGVKFVRREANRDVVETVQIPVTPKSGGTVNLSVRFDSGKNTIRRESYPLLNELAKALQAPELASSMVSVNGHTDSDGDPDKNRALSLGRALAVRKYLVDKRGIAPKRLRALGFGAEVPLRPNTSKENKDLNRRVEIALAMKE